MSNAKLPQPVYVTKYAITEGILVFAYGEIVNEKYFSAARYRQKWWIEQGEWFYDLDAAKERVKVKIQAKIRSHEKAITKLRRLATDGVSVKPVAE